MKCKRRIPGSKIISAKALVNEENKKLSKDSQNRKYVVNKLVSYVDNGLLLEQALDKIMQDDIVKEFEYLTKNGLDMRKCFRDWTQREIAKPRRTNERTR